MNDDPNIVKTKPLARVGAKSVIISPQNNILVLTRSSITSRPGGNDFPGGGIDFGEHPTDAVCREVKEETGLLVQNPQLLTVWSEINEAKDHLIILGYYTRVQTEDIQLSAEHTKYRWIPVQEAAKLVWPEFHSQLLSQYLKTIS